MNQVSTKHRTQQVHIAAKIISSSPASKFLNLESLMSMSILRDILGSSALHLAFMTGNVGLASVLLKYGADLYVFFSFLLSFSLTSNSNNTYRYAKNAQGNSVLDVAQSNGHGEIMTFFCHTYCERNKMKIPNSKLDELNKKKRNGGSSQVDLSKPRHQSRGARRSRADMMHESLDRSRYRGEKRARFTEKGTIKEKVEDS